MKKEEVKEFLASVGITKDGELENSTYTVDLVDSNEFSRMYSLLDKAENISFDYDVSATTEHTSFLLYLSDKYDISLIADFDTDKYVLTVEDGVED